MPPARRCSHRLHASRAHTPAGNQAGGQARVHGMLQRLYSRWHSSLVARRCHAASRTAPSLPCPVSHSRCSAFDAMEARQAPRCTIGASTPCSQLSQAVSQQAPASQAVGPTQESEGNAGPIKPQACEPAPAACELTNVGGICAGLPDHLPPSEPTAAHSPGKERRPCWQCCPPT